MANQQNVTQQQKGGASPTSARRSESAIRPPVDIFEKSDGIMLIADMPGVGKDNLKLTTEGNTLTIEGTLQFDMSQGMEALHADMRSTLYRCSFVLSTELQSDSIEAILKDGVLAVRIPKRPELRPRRIEVRSA